VASSTFLAVDPIIITFVRKRLDSDTARSIQ
jgi:hypothetical protein